MRNMMASARSARPVAWLKKHWVKVVIAIVVIYVIYWLFFKDDMENLTSNEIADLKTAMDDAKEAWDDAIQAQADVEAGTLADPKCTDSAVTPSSTRGCPAFTSVKKSAYERAAAAYAPYAPKKKKRVPSFRSKVRGFFGGIGKSFKKSTQKTKKTFDNAFDPGSIEQGIGMRW